MASNLHASAVVIGDRGILVSGASGAGKSGLALALMTHAQGCGLLGRLVGDDQVLLSVRYGRLVCTAPSTIAGLVELRGLGPQLIASEPSAVIDLHVRLVDAAEAPRFPESESELLAGCRIRALTLAAGDRQAAVLAVTACLSLPPFGHP